MRKERKHLFFDLDHTLWDFHANSARAFRRLLDEAHVPVDYDTFMQIYRPVNLQVWDDYAAGKYTKEQVKVIRLKYTFDRLGLDWSIADIDALVDRYLELLAEGTLLMPGALDLLEYLRPKYRLHLITNGFAEVQYRKLERSGLTPYFKTITLSEETGALKPHPSVFRHALRKAEAFPHESVMIGDSVKADILGAINVGMEAILYNPEDTEELPAVIAPSVKHLQDIKSIL